jgi:serine/threonine protein kinase
MGLTVATRLGPYEILAPIRVDGMGEVWKAADTRLGRIVAIKVLNGPHGPRTNTARESSYTSWPRSQSEHAESWRR